jgi:hypothetical protein
MPTAVKCHVRSVSAVVTCVEELKAVVGPQKSSDTWKASAYQAGQGFGQTPTTKLGQSMHATNVFKKVRKGKSCRRSGNRFVSESSGCTRSR